MDNRRVASELVKLAKELVGDRVDDSPLKIDDEYGKEIVSKVLKKMKMPGKFLNVDQKVNRKDSQSFSIRFMTDEGERGFVTVDNHGGGVLVSVCFDGICEEASGKFKHNISDLSEKAALKLKRAIS